MQWVFSETLAHGNIKIETRQIEESEFKKQWSQKKSPDSLAMRKKNKVYLSIIIVCTVPIS